MSKKLEIDTAQLVTIYERLQPRRIQWAKDERIQLTHYQLATEFNLVKILTWVDEHTTSEFYLGGRHIGFADPKDLLMFKLGWKP